MAQGQPGPVEMAPQARPDIQTLVSALTASGKGSARVATTTRR
jgi:hypothetical protein